MIIKIIRCRNEMNKKNRNYLTEIDDLCDEKNQSITV